MKKISLEELVGGALQEKFSKAFENVIENLQDLNTSYKAKRNITIKLSFDQNEARDEVAVMVDVVEKLAPQQGMKTAFYVGKDLRTNEVFVEEYGKQIKGQVSLNDLAADVEPEKQETADKDGVVDFRKVAGE